MKLKFWKRQRIPIETQTELIDLRAKVAEYAAEIVKLERREREIFETWRLVTILHLETDTDKQIADNMRAFWKEKADGALEVENE